MSGESIELAPEAGPNDQAVAGTLYHYGLTMYLIQVLEMQVVSLIVASNLPRRGEISSGDLRRIREDVSKKMMGKQLKDLIECVDIPPETEGRLRRVIVTRNRLAHGFFKDNYERMQSVEGNEAMIRELTEAQGFVVSVDEELTDLERSLWRASGLEYPF